MRLYLREIAELSDDRQRLGFSIREAWVREMAKLHTIREFLPARLSRPTFRLLMAKKHRELWALRTHNPANVYDRSFKPLVDHQCLFVHIPKTAGVSVGRALFGCKTGGHMTMLDYETSFSAEEIRRFYKFAFVRNPWDRVVSAYYYLKAGGQNKTDYLDGMRVVAPYRTFDEFVRGYLAAGRPQQKHFRPQYQFLCTSPWGGPRVDFIGRYEQLESDFSLVCARLGIEKRLDRENQTGLRPSDWRTPYSDQTAEIVAQIYARDIRMFGYAFERREGPAHRPLP